MKKNKKVLYVGLVIALAGIWLMIPAIGANSCPIIFVLLALFGTPVGFIVMLIGIFMDDKD